MSYKNSSVCVVSKCKSKNQQKSRKHVIFYRFPKDKDLARAWVSACNRHDLLDLHKQNEDYLYKNRYMICSNHFESTCFKDKNLLCKGLVKSAVPTKYLIPKRNIIKSYSLNMPVSVEIDEIKIKIEQQMCNGCLSVDRTTRPLGHLDRIYTILVGPVQTHDIIYFCWECIAILRRLESFQNQLKHAIDVMRQMYQESQSLTTLSLTHKDFYDLEISHTNICNKNDVKDDFHQNIKEETTENAKDEMNWIYNVANDSNVVDDSNGADDSNVDFDITTGDTENNKREKEINYNVNCEETDQKLKRKKLNNLKNIKKEYKSYANHICHKNWKKPYSQYFTEVKLDESEMECSFLEKDRQRQGYKMHLKCNICSLAYGRKIDLDRHNNLNHHKPNTPYKCLHCKETQSSVDTLKEHWRTHSVFYKCCACARVVFPCSLALHLSRSHVNEYACTNCTMTFSSLVSFSEHYNKNHPFICDYCNKKCALKSVLEKHIRNHHTPRRCGPCGRGFASRREYRAHARALHPPPAGAEPAQRYCVECDRQFPSRPLYMKHINSKHSVKRTVLKRTPCPECGKAFNKRCDMLLHYNFSHVKITKYHCDLCDKYFLKMYGLRTHMENVHLKLPKPKNKVCDLCGRAFQSNSVLNNHRRTHTGERPFKCGACPAAFAQKGAMKIHERKQHAA